MKHALRFSVILLIAWLSQSHAVATVAVRACPTFFKFHVNADVKGMRLGPTGCDGFDVDHDSDRDGIIDWMLRPEYGSMMYPLDSDMDGDGVPNVLDPNPFVAKASDVRLSLGFPRHLAYEVRDSLRQVPFELLRAQEELYRETGVYAINYNELHSVASIKALIRISRQGLPAGALRRIERFKYLYAFAGAEARLGALGYYIEPVDAIAVVREAAQGSERALIETLAHEVGHAYIFSMYTPSDLQLLGDHVGAMEAPTLGSALTSMLDRAFMKRLGGKAGDKSLFPSAYSRANIHELIAENFAFYVMSNMGMTSPGENKLQKFIGEHLNGGRPLEELRRRAGIRVDDASMAKSSPPVRRGQ